MKKSVLLFTFILALAAAPSWAQQTIVKKRMSMSLVKKRGNVVGNMLGAPTTDGTQHIDNQVVAAYYPTASSGVAGKENYYLVMSDKDNVVYDVKTGEISAANATIAALDLYVPEGTGIELPAGTFATSGDNYYDSDMSFVQHYDSNGALDDDLYLEGDVNVAKTTQEGSNNLYTVTFKAENGTTYVYEGELSFTNMSSSSSTVYPQITTDITNAVFTGGMAYYYGNLMESQTGNMVLDMYTGEYDEAGGMTSTGLDLTVNLYNRLFGNPAEAAIVPGVYTVARNFHVNTFFPGMEVDYMGMTILMGTYVKRRKALTGMDSDYDYCYIIDGTITIADGETPGTYDITIDCVTDRGHKVTGTAKGISFPITDKSESNTKDVDSNLQDDVNLKFDRVAKSRIYSLGVQNGCQIFTVDLGSPSGKDDPEIMGDQDLLRMEFQCPEGSQYLPEGTYTLMEQSHLYTNMYAPYQLTRGYFDEFGGRTGTKYEHFMKCEYPKEHTWVVDNYATVYAGTVGVTKTDNTHYKFNIDLYDGNGFKIFGEFDKEMEYCYNPDGITGIDGVAANAADAVVAVYSVGGQLLKTVKAAAAQSIADMPSGVYIVKSNNKTTKIVKK